MGKYYNVGDPEVLNVWERELGREVRQQCPILNPKFGLSGEGNTSLLQIKTALVEGPGSFIRTKLKYQLNGRGRAGEETLKGTGEGYKTSTFDIYVDILRHYVETSSPMTDQYVPEDTLVEGKDGLADWFSTRYDFSINLHGACFGGDLISDPAYTMHNDIQLPHADYILRPNGKTAGNLVAGDEFTVDFLTAASRRLKLLRPKIRPARVKGLGDIYCVFISPEQVYSLRQSNSEWYATMQNALRGGEIANNPLFSNALGRWGQFVLFESDFIPPGMDSDSAPTGIKEDTRRAWIGGAQALFLAHGKGRAPKGYGVNRYKWSRETEDFDHVGQVAASTIVGCAAPRYKKPGEASHRQNGLLVLETYAPHGMSAGEDVYADWITAGGGLSIV